MNPSHEIVEQKGKRLSVGTEGSVFKVAEFLVDFLVPIDELVQHPENYRNGDIEGIQESLEEHGQYKGIVVNRGRLSERYAENTIAAGNHTYQAALGNGWTHIAVSWIDVDDDELEDILLVDNLSSDNARNDEGLLLYLSQKKLDRGKGLRGTGLTPQMIEQMKKRQETGKPKGTDEPAVPEQVIIEIRCSYDKLGWLRETLDSWNSMNGVEIKISG